MNKIINLHIYPSSLTTATRILKEARSLINLSLVDELHLLGFVEKQSPLEEKLSEKIFLHRILLKSKTNETIFNRYFTFLEFFFKAIYRAPKYRANIVNCHSLHVLPIGVLLKIFTKAKLIYDAHELETEVKGAKGMVRIFAKLLERICMPFVDELIVVSDSIGDWYKQNYHIKNYTAIYNIPHQKELGLERDGSIFRKMYRLNESDILFIYQGILIDARGVDEILDAFRQAPKHLHVVFMGDGPSKLIIYEASKFHSNIHFHPYVNPSEVLNYTRGADVGIHIIKNTCLNHYYCLPNKIFEYLIAGIPFIVSNFPEMGKIVNSTRGGWMIQPNSQSLLDIIKKISKDELKEKERNIQKNKPNFGWEIEELKYIPLYNRIKIKLKKH
jgi:glycosyltransferase involved in cell wall biosynthesis